jgi:uncharacterized membrane protein YdjX (TVP38/TMEM64 family)
VFRALVRIGALVGVILVAVIIAWRLEYFELGRRERLVAGIHFAQERSWAVPVFVLSYAAAVTLALPTTVLTILGGALFGITNGVVLAWMGAMAGTTVAHTLARSIAKGPIRRLLDNKRMLHSLRQRADLLTLMRLRVLPLAPFGVLDYVAGALGVPLRDILLATGVAILPGTAAYAFAGDRLRAGLADPSITGRRAIVLAALVTLAVTAIALLPWLVGKLRAVASNGTERADDLPALSHTHQGSASQDPPDTAPDDGRAAM